MAFSYYGIVLLTTELFQIDGTCEGKVFKVKSIIYKCCFILVHSSFIQNSTVVEKVCNLKEKDYIDLLLTTVSEFPGMLRNILNYYKF